MKENKKERPKFNILLLVGVCFVLSVILAISYYSLSGFKIQSHPDGDHPFFDFKEKLKEVCAHPKLAVPEYKGAKSFFDFLMKPDVRFCYSFLHFGGEKLTAYLHTATQNICKGVVRKEHSICFNKEYEMSYNPCLVYSFTKDADQQFEQDMHIFSCNVHVFDAKQITQGEQVTRTKFWKEYAWDIGEYTYDIPAKGVKGYEKAFDGVIRRRSLDFIAHVLGHEGKVIKYLKSDHEGREWILMKQIVAHHNLVDIRQFALRLHLPLSLNTMSGTERHDYLQELFEIFQGLSCVGYKYIMAEPIGYYKGKIKIPESNKTYYPAYEVNFAKVLDTAKTFEKPTK